MDPTSAHAAHDAVLGSNIGPEGRGNVGHLLHEAKGPGYAPKAVVLIEGGGVLVDRVDHDEPRSDCLGGRQHSRERFG